MPDRLSPIEAVMWRAGHDPSLRMTVGIVVLLDRVPSLEALEERFAAVIKRSPRLQLRPGGESFGHTTPSWLEDDVPGASIICGVPQSAGPEPCAKCSIW